MAYGIALDKKNNILYSIATLERSILIHISGEVPSKEETRLKIYYKVRFSFRFNGIF